MPAYAGLIYITEYTNNFGTGYTLKTVKNAPFLHKNVKDHKVDLLQKYYWKCNNDRNDLFFMILALERDNLTEYQEETIKKIKEKFF